jgi:hypothetical protein
MSGEKEQRAASGGATLMGEWNRPTSTDENGRQFQEIAGHRLYGGTTDEGTEVDSQMFGRAGLSTSDSASFTKAGTNNSSSGKSASELLAEKYKNAGLNPDGTSGTSGAPQVTLPTIPTLPAVNLPAAPGLPTYTPPGTPPKLPALNPAAAAPLEGDAATNAARGRTIDAITARRGRQSTFLTTPSGRTPAAPLPKPLMARSKRTGAGVFGS